MINSSNLKQIALLVQQDSSLSSSGIQPDGKGKVTINDYYNRIVKQCKKLSQLIAISWGNTDNCKKIRNIFLQFRNTGNTTDNCYQEMIALLTGKRENLFIDYFPDSNFGPIFDEKEMEYYLIQVRWDLFSGAIQENPLASSDQKPPFFVLILPYPPKPDECNLENFNGQEFQSWLKEAVDINNPNITDLNPFPPIPYVPTTCC